MSRARWGVVLLVGTSLVLSWAALRANDSAEQAEVPITAEERQHWSYRPVADVAVPSVDNEHWRANPLDAFIWQRLHAKHVEPMPLVGKHTLLRRVCFDLTGLPPTPAQQAEFAADTSLAAYAKLVERLLASPAYAQRYAQHWLDLARFAETDGFEHDLSRPNAWRYRDWVINAFERDMPYDEFLRQQLAGDELYPDDPQAAVATGFLLCGPDMPDLNLQDERRHVVLNEMTATVGSVCLAMQFGCAQCHDHKFDPIRIQDFYRLRAFFESAAIFRDHPIPTETERTARQQAEAARDPQFKQAEDRRAELEGQGRDRFRNRIPDEIPGSKQILGELTKDERAEYRKLGDVLKQAPPLPKWSEGRVLRDGPARVAHVALRGDFRQPGTEVPCGLPRVIVEEDRFTTMPERPRAALAAWIVDKANPLTARVMVNRLWQWHFGAGLSSTASDFGTMGTPATHPELLDWLAARFMAEGWSLKPMHRLIVSSRTYQLASAPFDRQWSEAETAAARATWQRSSLADPEVETWWRRRRTRLDGESIRDAMLAASDQLSPRVGGPGIRPPLAPEVTETLLKDQWKVTDDEEDHRRRSIFLFVRRNLRYPLFDVFDRPDTNASCALRHESTTATQSLSQFNSRFSLDAAGWLASAIARQSVDVSERINAAYLRVFNRAATAGEIAEAREFLRAQAERLKTEGRAADLLTLPAGIATSDDPQAAAALVDFCLALWNANEFLYVD